MNIKALIIIILVSLFLVLSIKYFSEYKAKSVGFMDRGCPPSTEYDEYMQKTGKIQCKRDPYSSKNTIVIDKKSSS